jgi:hypothetical protein
VCKWIRAFALACAVLLGPATKENLMTTTTSTAPSTSKLSPHLVWLFAFGAVAAGVGSSFALAGFGQKVTAAVYFGIVALGGFGSTYLTRASVTRSVLVFLGAALTAAVAYYFLVDYIFRTATTVMSDAVSGGQAHADGVKAGAVFGHFFGMFAAIVVFLETSVAGVAGVIAGRKAAAGGIASLSRGGGVRIRI